MNDILTRIVLNKKQEVEAAKLATKVSELEASTFFNRRGKSLKKLLQKTTKPGIIAEFKRRSPSAGSINEEGPLQSIIRGYVNAGAIGISVLTDNKFFGGKIEDLQQARQVIDIPLLRKDFIIDEFQIYEAKAYGADIVLLIAEILTEDELEFLAKKAKESGLEVLCEIHSEEQLVKLNDYIDIVGVNNRDLTNFEISTENSLILGDKIPEEFIKISESGISGPQEVNQLFEAGFKGFLIGSYFMSKEQPALEAKHFIQAL